MSAYKSYSNRRPVESTDSSTNDKLKVDKLQELFPSWSAEDLSSVLLETGGDVELAVTRISEGHAEQWGSVSRKKDKKTTHGPQSSSHPARGDRDKTGGDTRGGRGGRGGRGRGGGGRGAPRGNFTPNRTHTPGGSAAVNGGAAQTPAGTNGADTPQPWGTDDATPATTEPSNVPSHDPNEASVGITATTTESAAASSAPAWGPDPVPETPAEPVKAAEKAPVKTSKVPAGAKLSWAQIARASEKPKQPAPAPPPQPPISQPVEATKEEIPLSDQQAEAWEEPTTVQQPVWEEAPSVIPSAAPEPQITTQDGWITTETTTIRTAQEVWEAAANATPPQSESAAPVAGEQAQAPSPPASVSFTSTATTTTTATASVATSTAPTSKPTTPLVSQARPVPGHRVKQRPTDQAVAFAGNIGTPVIERLGMQFGSLGMDDDSLEGPTFKAEPEAPAPETQQPQVQAQQQQVQPQAQQPQQQPQAQQPAATQAQQQPTQAPVQSQVHDVLHPSVAPAPALSPNQALFQQQTQQTAPAPVPAQAQPQQVAPQQAHQPAAGPPFGTHPPALSHQQQQQQLSQQHQQQQQLHSYASQQHGIHSHFDGPSIPQQQTQHTPGPQTNSYFRQADSPYYHNPTPPQSAPPEHQSAYNAFSPLGVAGGAHSHSQGLGGQGAAAHLGGFGAGGPSDYGYADGQRGFYDYQQTGFSNRLGHDEPTKAGLPLSQANQPTGSLGSTAAQPQTSAATQATSGQPPAGQQGQQGYPAPMPYYYPPYYPQNSYPTYPNPSYGQAYMPKYPPVYPHQGPVGPGSAPPPGGKGPGANATYNSSSSQSHLYHGQGGFDDPNAGYHQGSGNISASDYQKQTPHHQQQQQQPLYSSQTGQGLQSFLGIPQSTGAGQGVGGPGTQQRSGASPETAYKPYGAPGGASDKSGVGIGSQPAQQGRASGIQQSQQQGGASSFYPAGRFGSAAGGPQPQGQQQGQGYPQSTEQNQFYPYQPRHQGGYWQ